MKQLKKADLKTLLGLGTDMLTLTLAHTWPRFHAASCSCRGRDHLLQALDVGSVLQLWHQRIDIHNIWAFKKVLPI